MFEFMRPETKIVGAIALASTVGYFVSRHFDKAAQEEALSGSPEDAPAVHGEVVNPVDP